MFDQEISYQAERLNLLRMHVAVEADTIATRRTRPGSKPKRPTVSRQARFSYYPFPFSLRPAERDAASAPNEIRTRATGSKKRPSLKNATYSTLLETQNTASVSSLFSTRLQHFCGWMIRHGSGIVKY